MIHRGGRIQCEIRFANSRCKGRELEPGSGQRRAVQAQLDFGPGVRSLAPALRNGITRGVLSLTCPRTPALGQTAPPSSTPDPRPAVNSLKKSTPDPRNRKIAQLSSVESITKQSFILTEVSDCGLLIVVTSSTFLKSKDMFKEKSS